MHTERSITVSIYQWLRKNENRNDKGWSCIPRNANFYHTCGGSHWHLPRLGFLDYVELVYPDCFSLYSCVNNLAGMGVGFSESSFVLT